MWATLEGVPNEVLSRPLLDGSRLHCIKDLVFHIPSVEGRPCLRRFRARHADGRRFETACDFARLARGIAVLLRTQGIKPASLDLLFYLPS
jgi:hypothetical protein